MTLTELLADVTSRGFVVEFKGDPVYVHMIIIKQYGEMTRSTTVLMGRDALKDTTIDVTHWKLNEACRKMDQKYCQPEESPHADEVPK